MPDWRLVVEQRLATLPLPQKVRAEVFDELAGHLEDRYEQLLKSGMEPEEAKRRTADLLANCSTLKNRIVREKEGDVSAFGKQVLIPALVAFLLASVALALAIKFGPRPTVLPSGTFGFVIYPLWIVALVLIGGMAAMMAKSAGAHTGRRLLAALSPALIMLAAMIVVLVIAIPVELFHGSTPSPQIFLFGFLYAAGNWVVLPGVSAVVGALPLLRERKAVSTS